MKPVMQRQPNDCLRACLASIFEVPWEDAPDTGFDDGRDERELASYQMKLVSDWLAARGLAEWDLENRADPPVLRRGISRKEDGTTTPANFVWPYPWVGHYIGSGISSRGVDHAVVMLHGEIVHDPHPSQDMTIDRIDTIHVFVARDPEPDRSRIEAVIRKNISLPLSFARARKAHPGDLGVWNLEVTDQVVLAMGDQWSEPVQFRFCRLEDGRLDMLIRRASEVVDDAAGTKDRP